MNDPYRIETTPTFERDFKRLDAAMARRVSKKIVHLAAHPELLGQPLRNMPRDLAGLHKYRVGDFRVLYWVYHSERLLRLYAVQHRSTVYRDL
jgi:mRNA interferase RelE/StbE